MFKKKRFKGSIFLVIFFFTSALAMVGNAMADESDQVPTVTTILNYDTILLGYPNADEGMTRAQSRFPENPELYFPMPIPEPMETDEQEVLPHPENKLISYNLITGEEMIHDTPYTDEGLSISGLIKGGMGGGIIRQEEIGDEETTEEEYWPVNFSDLTKITNPEDYPWRVNVKLYITFASGNYVGSGVLIDPRHVLTAGHNVHDVLNGGTWAYSMVVAPAYENDLTPYGDASGVAALSWTGWTDDGDLDHDMAVIYLDRPIGALTSWHRYGYNDSPSFYTDNYFHSAGYPAESPYDGEYMYYWYGTFDFTDSLLGLWYGNEVGFDKRAYSGQSGSGVYYYDLASGNNYVYAVISNTVKVPEGPTKCPRITSDKLGDITNYIADHTPSTFDLIPLDVTSSPSSTCAGNQLSSMSYLVHNYSSASWSGTVGVDVYLSTDDNISTSDTLIQSHNFTYSFGPNNSVRVNVTTPPTIPSTVGGDYYLGVILDISDHNTGNNDSDGQDANPINVNPLPSTPSNITYPSSDCDGSFTVSWSSVSGATSYTLQRATNSSFSGAVTVYSGSSTSWDQTGLGNGTYYYRVSATNSCGSSGWRTGGAINITAPCMLSVTPSEGLTSSGDEGGPFNPSNKTYTLENTGGSSISWTASKGQAWVTLSSNGGTLASGASTTVIVSINSNANSLETGSYSDTVSFTNTTNGNGKTSISVILIVGNQPPTASFTADPTSGKAPFTVSFDAGSSTDPDGDIVLYAWDFGDGGGGNSMINASHEYVSRGTFTVTLTVRDDDGATDSATTIITVTTNGGGGGGGGGCFIATSANGSRMAK